MTRGADRPPALICRGVAVRDIPALFKLCGELGYDPSPDRFGERIRDLTAWAGNAVFVAADADDRPVGFIHVFSRPSIEVAPCAQVQALVISEAARRQGAGALLLAAAEQWARAQGLGAMSLYCSSHREDAHEFYAAQGYDGAITAIRFQKNIDKSEMEGNSDA